jgi:predicted Zn-ribbon and HTH transcriptional regulator
MSAEQTETAAPDALEAVVARMRAVLVATRGQTLRLTIRASARRTGFRLRLDLRRSCAACGFVWRSKSVRAVHKCPRCRDAITEVAKELGLGRYRVWLVASGKGRYRSKVYDEVSKALGSRGLKVPPSPPAAPRRGAPPVFAACRWCGRRWRKKSHGAQSWRGVRPRRTTCAKCASVVAAVARKLGVAPKVVRHTLDGRPTRERDRVLAALKPRGLKPRTSP